MSKFLFSIALSLLFSTSVMAGITKVSDGYELETCGQKSGEKYNVIDKQNSSITQGGTVNSKGCIKTTFRGDKLRAGDNLIIQINGKTVASETVPGHPSTFEPEANPGNYKPTPLPGPQQPKPNPTKPDPMPAPSLPNADLSRVRQTADNQARMIANKVVAKYGASENARYNMWLGLNEGVRYYLQMASLYGDQYYKSGMALGGNDGMGKGLVAGKASGQTAAQSDASAEVRRRFRGVVDSSQQPDINLTIPQNSYAGLPADIPEPKSIDQRIRERNSEFYGPIGSYEFSEKLPVDELYGWKQYQFSTVRNWYSGDWAWNVWLNRSLGGGYESEITYYQKISDRNQTGNAVEAQSAFSSQFRNVYNYVIDEKWDTAVTRPNPSFYQLGMALGQSIGRDYANDKGYVDGFRNSYRAATVTGFNQTYPQTYSSTFRNTVSLHQSQPVIAEVAAHPIDNTKGTGFFLPGVPFNLVIERVVNMGARGTVDVAVGGAAVVPGALKTINVDQLSSTKDAITIDAVGTLASDASPYTASVFQVRVGQAFINVQVQVFFENVIRVLAINGDRRFVDYTKLYLSKEFSNAGRDSYKAGKRSLPEMISAVYNESNPAGKAKLASFREEFRSVLGSEPGSFMHPIKNQAWRDAQSWLNTLK